MASIISAGTTSATALNMSADTSGVLQLASNNGTVGLTIDTSQRVGIGTTSPITTGGSVLELSNSANCIQTITCTNDTTSLLDFRTNGVDRLQIQSSSNWGAYFLVRSNQIMKFGVNNAEVAQFDTSGNFLIGTTTANGARFAVGTVNDTTGGNQSGWISGTKAGYAGYVMLPQNQFAVMDQGTAVGAGGAISFMTPQGSSSTWGASIQASKVASGSSDYGCDMLLFTRPSGGVNTSPALKLTSANNAVFAGSVSKASGSFRIDHPLPELESTHQLVHSFIEGPQADNIYRGKVTLASGVASVNIDANSGMTEGTFVVLNREVQCFTTNETGWTPVRGAVNGNILTIEAQDNSCNDTISWMVIGERKDKHMMNTEWTDENGKVIVEPLKPQEPVRVYETLEGA